jgi:nitrite reductase/ring-hydroxylating ferredoxin subunit
MKFLCAPQQLTEGQSRGFLLDGINLLAVRRDGQVYAYRNRCPHRGVPLEWQPDQFLDHSQSMIQCATHGALFLIESGECVAGPCAGQSLKALSCREDSEGVWLKL